MLRRDVRSFGCAPSCCRAELSSQYKPKPSFIEAASRIAGSRTTYEDSRPAYTSSRKTARCTLAQPESRCRPRARAAAACSPSSRPRPTSATRAAPRVGVATPAALSLASPNMNSAAYSAPPVVAGLVAGAASPASSSVAPSFKTGGSRHHASSPSLS